MSLSTGFVDNNAVFKRNISVLGASAVDILTCSTCTASGALNAVTSTISGSQTVGSINVLATTNVKDASTGTLTSAAMTVAGGCIISADSLVKGTANAFAINTGKLTTTDVATLQVLQVLGNATISNGYLYSNNATDYSSTTSPGSFNFAGGGRIGASLALGAASLVLSSAIVNSSNVLRVTTSDTTNAAVRVSVGNNAMANNYYESSLTLWALGANLSSTNSERMLLGVNSAGGYITYASSGTGTLKPLNILQGAIFNNGGALQLNTSLNINGVTRIASPSSAYTLTEPSALPTTNNMVLTSSTTGVQTWKLPGFPLWTGDGASIPPSLATTGVCNLYVLTQTLQSNGGQIVFYLTSTGTSSGTVLGTSSTWMIWFAARSPSSASSTTNGPTASEAYRGTNGVVANVYTNRISTIVVGGTTSGSQAAPTGTIVTCFALIPQ